MDANGWEAPEDVLGYGEVDNFIPPEFRGDCNQCKHAYDYDRHCYKCHSIVMLSEFVPMSHSPQDQGRDD